MALGVDVATAFAIPLGLGIETSERFREYTFPALELFRPIPPVAWVPKRLRYAFDRSAYPAIGTVGTPFAIAVVLYLLNSKAVSASNSTVSNLGGFGLLLVSGGLAANFIREQVASGFALLSGALLVFAAALGIATAGLLAKFVREEVSLT